MTKNLKSLALLAVVVLGMAGMASAESYRVNTPRNQRNEEVSALYGGYRWVRNSNTAEMLVCTGRCLLAGIITGTGPVGTEIRVRNTGVIDGTAARLALIYPFKPFNSEPGNNPIRLPMVFDQGIAVKLTAASTGEEVTVLYQDLDE